MATSLGFDTDSEFELESSDSEAPSTKSVPSGYSYDFISTPPEDLTCRICLCVFRDPNLISCCGNHFCDACITRIKSGNKPCPLCNEKHFVTLFDKSIGRKVKQLGVKCSNNARGCEWVGELGSVDKHLDKTVGTCQFVVVDCGLKCGARVSRQRLNEHMTERCPMRPYNCKHCGLKGKYKEIQETHVAICPTYPMPCPNNCTSLKIQRRNLETHLKEKCPLTKQSCFFEFAGCKKKLNRKNEVQHAKDSAFNHLQLVTDVYLTLKNELTEKDKEIEQLKLELKCRGKTKATSRDGCKYRYPPVDIIMCGIQSKLSGEGWCSEPFYTHPQGYKMCLTVYARGVVSCKGTHVSVFANLMKGEFDDQLKWPFHGEVTVKLLIDGQVTVVKSLLFPSKSLQSTCRVTKGNMHSLGWGEGQFVEFSQVQHQHSLHFIVSSVDCN